MNKLLLIPLFAVLLIFSASFAPADATKSQGTSASRVGVDICGDRLCEAGEKMAPQEKLGYYLMSLLEFEMNDDSVLQQGRYAMSSTGDVKFNSAISRGQYASQSIPTISAKSSSTPSVNPGEAKFFNPQPEPPGKDLSPSKSFAMKEYSQFTAKGFDSSAKSIAGKFGKNRFLFLRSYPKDALKICIDRVSISRVTSLNPAS